MMSFYPKVRQNLKFVKVYKLKIDETLKFLKMVSYLQSYLLEMPQLKTELRTICISRFPSILLRLVRVN